MKIIAHAVLWPSSMQNIATLFDDVGQLKQENKVLLLWLINLFI